MKKTISILRAAAIGLALIITPAVLFTSCWEDLDDVLGKRGGIVYNVVYYGNGSTEGSPPVDYNEYRNGQVIIILSSNNITKINVSGVSYKFNGWNTQEDGNGESYNPGDSVTVQQKNIELYAKWVPYVLRDTGPAGGLIFYIKADYSGGWRYLEAAPVSTEWNDAQWGLNNTFIGNTGMAIGTGQLNTNYIVDALIASGDPDRTLKAAYLCSLLSINGYNDWFLPSHDELYQMFLNLKAQLVGDFLDEGYWSSSENDQYTSYLLHFNGGSWYTNTKSFSRNVRAARAF
jgi:uncharacterized repeat protein (TIGR02543 family)